MGVITRSNHPSALWPGIKAMFGLSYGEHAPQWSRFFDKETSDKAYEEKVEVTGFGLAPVKGEGQSISFDETGEGYKNRWTHVVYGLGAIVTREELEDDQYEYVGSRRSKGLAFSMKTTAETVHANVFNRAFSASFVGGDAVALLSNAHPTLAGNQSNLLTAADLSETALEDGVKVIMQMKNSRGLNVAAKVKRLAISTDEVFNATRILESQLRQGTPNNDVNALKAMGTIPEVAACHYFADSDAWFLQTDVPEGLASMWRREAGLEKDNDFDTENAKMKSTMRFAAGYGDWRALYGSAGA